MKLRKTNAGRGVQIQTMTISSSQATASFCSFRPAQRLLRRRHPPPHIHISAANHLLSHPTTPNNNNMSLSKTTTRRSLLLLLLPLAISPSPPSTSASPAQLESYTDAVEGFTLLKPSSWVKVEKAGATALFEEEGKGSNSIGVVVNPVRLSSLGDFGTPQFVADKLIQAERRKESTNSAEVITASQRLGHGGIPVYEFEYTVDSTRGGMKRIFSAAFVASKKLYLLNIAHSDRPDNPLDSQTRTILEQVLHSFDTAS